MTDGQAPVITAATRVAAVIGDPVHHSLSPRIHNAGFAATGLDWVYVALPVERGSGAKAVESMRTFALGGLNVTMPHKAQVAAAVDRQSASVARLGVCNCVFWDGDVLVGDNTDGDGFVSALRAESGADPSGMRVAVLGAGGAARAIIDALARNGVAEIKVINRSPQPAQEAAELAGVASAGRPEDAARADLIVNATSMGMAGNPGIPLDPALLTPHQIIADIVYEPVQTQLLAAAKSVGATGVGGLGMLVHQAAASFEHFTKVDAPLDVMKAAVQEWLTD